MAAGLVVVAPEQGRGEGEDEGGDGDVGDCGGGDSEVVVFWIGGWRGRSSGGSY